MELLAEYNSESCSDDELEGKSCPIDSSSSGSSLALPVSSEDVKKKRHLDKPKSNSLLPSVDLLFASTSGPSFLSGKKDGFEVSHFKKMKGTTSEPSQSLPNEVTKEPIAPVQTTGSKAPPIDSKLTKERLTRKERVKNQRIKGQVWRPHKQSDSFKVCEIC
jgi:hypothetical protein